MVDTRGRLIYSKTTTEKLLSAELDNLRSGTYFVRAKDELDTILITRLVTVID
ncbi:MAG: hypothetical protein HRT57_12205 [Crocinitomicaceae bacterium]|nr:hypothetical protein [Crocinitomicaceae bacterium]